MRGNGVCVGGTVGADRVGTEVGDGTEVNMRVAAGVAGVADEGPCVGLAVGMPVDVADAVRMAVALDRGAGWVAVAS